MHGRWRNIGEQQLGKSRIVDHQVWLLLIKAAHAHPSTDGQERARLKNPPRSPLEYIDKIEQQQLPQTAAALREFEHYRLMDYRSVNSAFSQGPRAAAPPRLNRKTNRGALRYIVIPRPCSRALKVVPKSHK